MSKNGENNEEAKFGATYHFGEMDTPSLVFPRLLTSALQSDEKFALEVEQLVEVGEKEMNCILIDSVAL
jgi:hypothetical protein